MYTPQVCYVYTTGMFYIHAFTAHKYKHIYARTHTHIDTHKPTAYIILTHVHTHMCAHNIYTCAHTVETNAKFERNQSMNPKASLYEGHTI